MDHAFVWHDRVAVRLPRIEPAGRSFIREKCNASALRNTLIPSLITRTSAVNHRILVFWDQRRILDQRVWVDPLGPGYDFRLAQQIKWLTDVEDRDISLRHQGSKLLWRNESAFQLTPVFRAPELYRDRTIY
jgi:hypothetical protein